MKSDVVTAGPWRPLSQLLAWAARYQGDTTICLSTRVKVAGEVDRSHGETWDIPALPSNSITDRDAVIPSDRPLHSPGAGT